MIDYSKRNNIILSCFKEMLHSNINYSYSIDIIFNEKRKCESIETIEFIDNKINKTNMKADTKINNDDIIIKKNEKSLAANSTKRLYAS